MIAPKPTPTPDTIPNVEKFAPEERELLLQLLFEKQVSRNQQFARFEEPQRKRLHRISKHLKALHRELQRPDGEYWVEEIGEQAVCLHIHRPSVGLVRKVFLSWTEWELLQHDGWKA